jgi:hypothetical protein
MRDLAQGAQALSIPFYVVGDTKSPATFELAGADYYGIARQLETGLGYAGACPTRHYARKNIGYLLAARNGAEVIQETDDDNRPLPGFFDPLPRNREAALLDGQDWINIYSYFTDKHIWPRGYPLDRLQESGPDFQGLRLERVDCPIQQGLADGNPDVDAVFRMVSPMEVEFRRDRTIALGQGAWCPFNSQNTVWFRDAFPLMYLPAHCSFRMTDIWRGLVAQRVAWANGWRILFHPSTVWQDRNPHALMRDFQDEIPGYTQNARIAEALMGLALEPGIPNLGVNLKRCYALLVEMGLVGDAELPLVDLWLEDLLG